MQAIEQRICDGIGFAGHQRVSVVHHDTDNLHLHIAINKIHPQRYTIHEPYLAYQTLARFCDLLENQYGLQKYNHQARKCGAENRADDMEHHAGVESLIGWIHRTCKEELGAATSWTQLHAALAQHGRQVQARGNGLVIVADDGTAIKASSVGREFSKPKLELRLGQYLAAVPPQRANTDDTTAKRYAKLPLGSRFDTSVLYSQYQAAQAELRSIQNREWQRARRHKQRMIESVKGRARLQRAALRLAKLPRAAKELAYQAVNHHGLRREIERIHERYQSQRREIYRMHRPRQWATGCATKRKQEATTRWRLCAVVRHAASSQAKE
ncbi:MAG: TraI/MobA(P) family conjugative relaxase [Telluria sp.]